MPATNTTDDRPALSSVLFKRQCDGEPRDITVESVPRDFARALLLDEDLEPLIADVQLRRSGRDNGITPDSLQSLLLRRQRELAEIKATVRRLLWLTRAETK